MTSRNHVLSRAYRTAKDKMYKTLLDNSGSRQQFVDAVQKSILDADDGVPPATFYVSVRERERERLYRTLDVAI